MMTAALNFGQFLGLTMMMNNYIKMLLSSRHHRRLYEYSRPRPTQFNIFSYNKTNVQRRIPIHVPRRHGKQSHVKIKFEIMFILGKHYTVLALDCKLIV